MSMNTDHFLFLPADVAMPYTSASESLSPAPMPVYEEPETEAATEAETEAPTQAATNAPATVAATQAATIAPTDAPTAKGGFSDSLLHTLYIVIPILAAALIAIIVMLIIKNKKKKAAMNDPYPEQNGSRMRNEEDPFRHDGQDQFRD